MGSPCALSLYCKNEADFKKAVHACVHEMQRLENKYSRYLPNSLVSQINRRAGTNESIHLDNETWQLLLYADTAYQQSDGLFDITSGILRQAWDFKSKIVPEQETIDRLLDKIGWDKVSLQQCSFKLPLPHMQLDFGGIVKEYAADCLHKTLIHYEVHQGLVDLAGDIKVIGPHPDDTPWMIGIRNPHDPTRALAQIPMISGGLASSGDYARCFEMNGKRYSHILNPKTGWPVSGLAAVSVWAEQCVVAGSLATIAMLKEEEKSLQWLNDLGIPYVTVNQQLQVTSSEQLD